jgi:hypothetical protein
VNLSEERHVEAWKRGMELRMFEPGIGLNLPAVRGLLIGEAPGPNTDGTIPLFPHQPGCAASRLMGYAGLKPSDWLGRLRRVNLCEESWSQGEANAGVIKAIEWLTADPNLLDGQPLRVLLLGRRVADAWQVGAQPFGFTKRTVNRTRIRIAWIPHPSGRCLAYNDRKNQLRARRAVLWAAGMRTTP